MYIEIGLWRKTLYVSCWKFRDDELFFYEVHRSEDGKKVIHCFKFMFIFISFASYRK